MDLEFHRPPKGYEYLIEDFNKTTKRICIINISRSFVYNNGEPPKCVWGFFKPKTNKYYSPIDYKRVGKEVKLSNTTPYSAMRLNLNPLANLLYGN